MAERSLQQVAGPVAGRPAVLVGAGLSVIAVTYGLARYGFGLYLPQFRAEFGISAGTAGGLAAGGYLAYCAAALLAPLLVARGRARAALWVAGGSAALGSVVVATAPGTAVLAVGVLVAGSGAGAATPALVAAVAATVRPAGVARAQGVVNSGTGAGVVAGGLLVLAVPGAWRPAWLGFAVLALVVTRVADRSARWPAATGGPHPAGRPWDGLGRATAAAVLAGAGCAGTWTFGRDLLTADGGLAPAVSGALWCVLGAAGLAGGVSGALVERHGVRRAWCGSLLVAAAATTLLALRPGVPWLAGVALGAFGGSFVALSGVLIAWGARARPDGAAGAAAFLFVGLTAGQALGAVALGGLADLAGLPAALLLAAGTVLLAAGPVARPSGAAPAVPVRRRAPRRPGTGRW
ncbi:YbfB/YjiJ family MFS transporter [Geodermatophilus marinus]|uniref:YbfB/YjiJ family MFS transporter n=1 Tax=Geodermatophilus sp. LHW52908 TaxID=2303986 RepID=UPI000E3CB48D|nr:MFS transporter [Geodermatophilus sp. LHW52908]RFU19201.1 YbfB/YjiJ family MFS transporter [Geodermatophilus sp. LHW52908]